MFSTSVVVLDFETTGLSSRSGDRITEVAALRVREGRIVERYVTLVNASMPIPSFITQLTGISNEMLATAPPVKRVMRDQTALWRRHEFLAQYFAMDPDSGRLARTFVVPCNLGSARRQYRHFRWRFPRDVLFFQVGCFIELYDVGRPDWLPLLDLQPMRCNRGGARYGFPQAQLGRHLRTLLEHGRSVTIVREQNPTGRVLRRLPAWRFVVARARRFRPNLLVRMETAVAPLDRAAWGRTRVACPNRWM